MKSQIILICNLSIALTESQAALQTLESANKRRKRPTPNTATDTRFETGVPDQNLRAVRTRSGRIRKEITRLSYNHYDKDSVAMLYYSNN